jgi:small nuclear ribonucleoprotein (snRNP)-like protein
MATTTSDFGSRHAPDLYTRTAPGEPRSNVVVPAEKPTEQQVREMEWLCSMIGCALPTSFKATAAATATTADSTVAPAATAAPAQPAPLPSYIRVSLKDGRVYSGRLHCVDQRVNVILAHSSQLAGRIDDVEVGGFSLGQVLIAWRLIEKVEKQIEAPKQPATTT